jgi:choline kinase
MDKAIILAAGEGTRLRPYTLECPKCLVKVNGKCLLDYQLGVLRSQGVERIVLIKGYLSEKLLRPGIVTYCNEKYFDTNMVWTLFCAEEEMIGNVIVSYGDIVYSGDVLNKLMKSKHDISVVIDREWKTYWEARFGNPLNDAETLKIGPDGNIIEIGQKPLSLEEIEGQYIGLMQFTEKGLLILKKIFSEAKSVSILGKKKPENAYMTDLLQAVIDKGYMVWPVFIDGDWVEVDTCDDLTLGITKQRLENISKSISF